ncbi:hypothetical protein INR49_019961 [Caranx melampygus]|nr:hypothetical protein INR49_019961 [Caranx melampygus]
MKGREMKLREDEPTPRRLRVKPQPPATPGEGPLVMEESSVSPRLTKWIRENVEDLKIRQADRSWAAGIVNDFRDNLLKFLRSSSDQPFFQSAEFLTTGSYFEKVKIHSPDEFDMMLKLQAPSRLNMTPLDDGLFYRLDLVRATRSPIQAFLLENERTLSSSKVLSGRIVWSAIPGGEHRWEVNRKHVYSPAMTLSLCRMEEDSKELISVDLVPALEAHPSQGWPLAVRNGPDVDDWLGKKARQEIRSLPCYFVPKRLKARNLENKEEAKDQLTFIDSTRNSSSIKQCLMLLKSLIEGLKRRFPKELNDLCSYHGKTVFLHVLSVRFNDSQWAPQLLPSCFLLLLSHLENHAQTGSLPHFFVPSCNLFSPKVFPRRALAFLAGALREQRSQNLPLLRPPAPVSPLTPVTPSSDQSSLLRAGHCLDTATMNKLVMVFAVVFVCFLFLNAQSSHKI